MSYHSYADDTQVYQVIKPQGDWSDLSERLERCLSDIADWMTANRRLQISPTGFAKIQYSFGPKTEPCGTPKRSLISSDCTDPIATL
jgi:hypothetical protein